MKVKMKVSDAAHVEWLKTFGHVHRDTIKLILRQRKIIEDLVIGIQDMDHNELQEAFLNGIKHIKDWDKSDD